MKKKCTIAQLKKFDLFLGVSDDLLAEICQLISVRKFSRSEIVCAEAKESFSLFLIENGDVDILHKNIHLAVLSEGNYFGEMSLMSDNTSRSASVVAKNDVTLFELPFNGFKPIVNRSTTILKNLILTYDKRLRSENKMVVAQYQELQEKYEKLLQTEKLASIGTLTAGIAHEVNNPLAVITGRLLILEQNIKNNKLTDEMLNKSIDHMKKAATSIKDIIIGLKTYVKTDSGGEATIIDLNKAVASSIDLVSFLYQQEYITIKTELFDSELFVKANIGKIQQIILNLLSNGKDAMEKKRSPKEIIIKTSATKEQIILSVEDFGEGIPEDKLEKIFEKFYTSKPAGQGTGLGLDIIKSLVEDYSGTISVESKLGVGTKFTIVLPIASPN